MGNKKEVVKEAPRENMPSNVLSVRGHLVASNRFRGVCLILALIAVICASGATYVLASKPKIIVGINSAGQPQLLHETNKTIGVDLFCREFISRFLCFSPSTIEENMAFCQSRITPSFSQAYSSVLGDSFIKNVKEFGIVQVTSISNIEISDFSEKGFKAVLSCGRIKNDNVNKQTVEQKLNINLSVSAGQVTDANPWGFYVDQLSENVTQ